MIVVVKMRHVPLKRPDVGKCIWAKKADFIIESSILRQSPLTSLMS